MLLNIILLLISSLLIYTTIFTLYIEVNYISVVATHLKTFFLIRGNKIPPILEGETRVLKTVMMKHINHYF